MNEIFQCDHCGAVTVVPEREYFSGVCNCCGEDVFAAPEPEEDSVDALLAELSEIRAAKAENQRAAESVRASGLSWSERSPILDALDKSLDRLTDRETPLVHKIRQQLAYIIG